jgi:hypothetical protein
MLMTAFANPRVRYPLRAKVVVALAALVALAELATFALFMMPMIPLVPVFVLAMLGNAFVLADVVRWAASLGSTEAPRVARAEAARPAEGLRPPQARAA